jgi:16S rRNA (cytidine1402-2'-O)-methyltransferase
VLARELTKKFEEYLRGIPAELLARARQRPLKGEFVVLIAPVESEPALGVRTGASGDSAAPRSSG